MKEIVGQHNTAKVFIDTIDESSEIQIKKLCDQEFVAGSKIRIMPDVHAGAGCTIGTTMTITDKIFDKIPPLSFVDTVEALKSQMPSDVYKKILEVIEIKLKGLEKDIITRIFEFDQYFYASMDVENLEFTTKALDYKIFDELIYSLL